MAGDPPPRLHLPGRHLCVYQELIIYSHTVANSVDSGPGKPTAYLLLADLAHPLPRTPAFCSVPSQCAWSL